MKVNGSYRSKYFVYCFRICILFFLIGIAYFIATSDIHKVDMSNFRRVSLFPTLEDKSNNPACLVKSHDLIEERFDPEKYDKIYLYHTRKAGGTTLRNYLTLVKNHYKLDFEVTEGGVMKRPKEPNVFYITSLRVPVERSISHFKYNQRWPCKKLVQKKIGYIPTEDNAKPFIKWLQGNYLEKHSNLWDCSSECYVHWFTNGSIIEVNKAISEGYNNLMKFDIILLTRLMHHQSYIENIERFFNISGYRTRSAFCVAQSHTANEKYPLHLSNSEIELLRERNKMDTELYDLIDTCNS